MRLRSSIAVLFLLSAGAARAQAGAPDVRALRLEVAALQVDRALNLSPEQARALLPVLQSAARAAADARAQRQAALAAALTRARDDLRSAGAISEPTRQALAAARAGGAAAARPDFRAVRDQVRQVLTPDQLKALRAARTGRPPGGMEKGWGGGRHRRGAAAARVLTSDPFLALLQGRAG
jgi:hypothetical protein